METIKNFPKSEKYQLFVVGSGKLKGEISSFLQYHDAQNVKLVGPLEQDALFEFISLIDIGILLSSSDPSPKVLNEFLDFGVPCIISSDVGTARDLIKNDVNGYVIEQISTHSIELALEKIIKRNFFKDDDKFEKHMSVWSGQNWVKCFSQAMLDD